jgi:hypothetical protein
MQYGYKWVCGVVVEEGTCAGEVAGSNPAGREVHDFHAKNAATCDLRVCDNEEAWLIVRIRPEHYFNGYDVLYIKFNELHQLLNGDALDKSLLNCWCL